MLVLAAGPVVAQSPATGRLLVATADLPDPNFAESVLLLLHHDAEGSLAIFINRPTWVAPADAFSELGRFENYGGRVFLGGPIALTQLLMLVHSPPDGSLEGADIVDDVHVSTDLGLLDGPFSGANESTVRLYAGYAAWGPGQLEAEIASDSWKVVPGRAEYIFSSDPLKLWERLSSPEPEFVVKE